MMGDSATTAATIIQIAERVAGASGATALLLVLYGSYRGWWIWGRQLAEERLDYTRMVDDIRADYKRQIEDIRADREHVRRERDEYKTMLLRTLRVAETTTAIAAKTANEG